VSPNFIKRKHHPRKGENPTPSQVAKTRVETTPKREQGMCPSVWPCHLTLKVMLSQKKNHGNSNISPCKNKIFKKSSKKNNQNPSRYYNSIISNLKFRRKPK
jgi:hypothetical protein